MFRKTLHSYFYNERNTQTRLPPAIIVTCLQHNMLPSTLHIIRHMHLQSFNLLHATVRRRCIFKKEHYLTRSYKMLPSTLRIIWPISPAKFEVAMSDGFRRYAFTENTSIDLNLGSRLHKSCPVPSLSCDLCTCKVWVATPNSLEGDAFT